MRRLARTLVPATALGALAALAVAPAASAGPVTAYVAVGHAVNTGWWGYGGGCRFETVNVAPLTGQSWVGVVSVDVAAPSAARVTDVSCTFLVNGVSHGTLLTAPDGDGATADAERFEYSAAPGDDATICTHVTVGGTVVPPICARATVTPVAGIWGG